MEECFNNKWTNHYARYYGQTFFNRKFPKIDNNAIWIGGESKFAIHTD